MELKDAYSLEDTHMKEILENKGVLHIVNDER